MQTLILEELVQDGCTRHSTHFLSYPWNNRSAGQEIICTATGEEKAGKWIAMEVS